MSNQFNQLGVKPHSASNLDKAKLLISIEILLQSVRNVPEMEKKLLMAKERVVFNQNTQDPKKINFIEDAYKTILSQLPKYEEKNHE